MKAIIILTLALLLAGCQDEQAEVEYKDKTGVVWKATCRGYSTTVIQCLDKVKTMAGNKD